MHISIGKREFASGAEAVAYYLKGGFSRVEDDETSEGVIVMDDGINIVRIQHTALLLWVATEHWVED